MNRFIDIHSHILYGVDDGAEDLQTSLNLIEVGEKEGIELFVLTPHLYSYDHSLLAEIENNFYILQKECLKKHPKIKLLLGGEIHYTHELFEFVKNQKGLFGEKQKMLLLEFDFEQYSPISLQVIEKIKNLDIQPVIAHPERILPLANNHRSLIALKEAGALFQLTAASILGSFGKKAEQASRAMLSEGVIDFVASDVHHAKYRPFEMVKAYKIVKNDFGEEYANQIFYQNQYNYLLGDQCV